MLETWPEVFISPIGTVGKGEEDIRVINDYAYPRGASVIDFTDRDNFPRISYNPPRDIARRIHDLRTEHPPVEVLLLLGDVSGAFRHVPISENSVHMFAFLFEDYVVFDLSCGFGWCGSPAFYSLAGSVINHLYEPSRPEGGAPLDREPFGGNVWCDDHACVERNVGSRCKDAEVALRRSMITVLGPNAINEEKFTSWQTTGKALSLLWDTVNGTVSIPTEKLLKAQLRVHALLQTAYASKSDLNKLLGSLRHVAACFPAARSFYQRLHASAVGMHPGSKRQLNEDDRDDLFWFRAVLLNGDRFNKIPVVQFAGIATPTVHIFMDASDTGLCALEPTRLEYIRVKFTDAQKLDLRKEPRVNSINVRELQSAVLAALYWGQYWQQDAELGPTYVCFHIDNSSAVAWANRRSARNPAAQLLNRLLSLAELQYRVVFTAEHVPGIDNIMADAGSRERLSSIRRSLNRVGAMLCRQALAGTTNTNPGADRTNRLGYFAVYLWTYGWNRARRGNQYATIVSKLASVSWFHRRFQGIEITRSPQLRILLQGIKRLSDPVRKKQPVTPSFLRLLRRSLNLDRPRQRLLWSSVLLGYFFLLRHSEFLIVEGHRPFYSLKTKNAMFTDSNGQAVSVGAATAVTIGLEGSKNDQYGRGAWRTMHSSGDKLLCPAEALRHILVARRGLNKMNSEYLCLDLDSKTVAKALKATAEKAGVPASNYATHSLRIGGASALLNGKVDSLVIKILGQWVSRCYEEYPRQAAAATIGLTKRMV
ncbi:hypothetical protein F441_10847 [Phytophthora nicotianae CJ01A1]|uniref:Tyr recombinase domain-containing protein n=1 Tax=Phytophthora nicotianae CJ01A1 TaxID=1317063 RepID=W2WV51_PHYNI|nr:hypothetical protein F441_10847 [Phytophthora nicotianae CJ01A1]